MSIHCPHERRDFLSKNQTKSDESTHRFSQTIQPSSLIERNFESMGVSFRTNPNSEISYLNRNYGWDEINENEQETIRLQKLLDQWNAERLAILKLQYELNRNFLQRTIDYMKRLGQSIGIGLWLWTHRPKQQNNSQSILNHSPSTGPVTNSWWLNNFIFDRSNETLPPIASVMKTIIDNDVFPSDSSTVDDSVWPILVRRTDRLTSTDKKRVSFVQRCTKSSTKVHQ